MEKKPEEHNRGASLYLQLASVDFQAAYQHLLHYAGMLTLLVRPTFVSKLEYDLKIAL